LYHALVKEHLDKHMQMPVQEVEDELMKEIQ